MNADTDARVPRRVVVAACCIEAAGALALAGIVVVTLARGRAADIGGSVTEAAVAVLIAAGLVFLASGSAQGRRWPLGLIVTAQLLIAVVALSQLGAVLGAPSQQALMLAVLIAALVCAVSGLWGAVRLAGSQDSQPPARG